jgi:hypothetical protein
MDRIIADTPAELQAWCTRLSRESSVNSNAQGRTLRGELAFELGIAVDDAPCKSSIGSVAAPLRYLYTADLCIVPVEPVSTAECREEAQFVSAVRSARAEGCVVGISQAVSGSALYGEVSLVVSKAVFERLWLETESVRGVELKGVFACSKVLTALPMENGETHTVIAEPSLRLVSPEMVPREWVRERSALDFQDGLVSMHFHHKIRGQVDHVVGELADAAACIPRSARPRLLAHMRDLIAQARAAFREPLALPGLHDNLWLSTPAVFESVVGALEGEAAKRLRFQYDLFWTHFSVATSLSFSSGSKSPEAAGYRIDVPLLEALAEKLLAVPGVYSGTLEWALMDALVYAECISRAQIAYPRRASLPHVVARAVLPRFVEASKVAATFAGSYFLSDESVDAALLVTTALTSARWVRAGLSRNEGSARARHQALLDQMIALSDLFRTPKFNARLARELVYQLAHDGADFSPWVCHLLDARVRREDKAFETEA